MLNRIELDRKAFEYLRDQLWQGDIYSNRLLEVVTSGKIFTYLPEQVYSASLQLEKSISLATGVRIYEESRDVICKFISEFLDGEGRISLLETLSTISSIQYRRGSPPIKIYNEQILFWLTTREKTEIIRRALKGARHYPFVCGLIDLSNSDFLQTQAQEMSESELSSIVHNTQYIIVEAYDSEGFMVWDRQG